MTKWMIVALLIVAVALAGLSLRAQGPKVEYKVLGVGPYEQNDEIAKKLNTETAAGWELVAALPVVSNNVGILGEKNPERILTQARLILKRTGR